MFDGSLTDIEKTILDDVIVAIPSRVRRLALHFDEPRLLNQKHSAEAEKLDKLILEILKDLKRKISDEPAEKFHARLLERTLEEGLDDAQGSLGIFTYRLMDTVDCMVAIKGTYKGEPRKSRYDRDYAARQLRLRGILKK